MDRIWAPWRIRYILADEKPEGCIFCSFPEADDPAEHLVLYRDEHAFAIMNRFPYNNGHIMVIPRQHADRPGKLDPGDFARVTELLRVATEIIERRFEPDGMNVGMNLGEPAGAGIADHLHWHIVPRWKGDTNFMPVLADTRVIGQHIDETFELLRDAFESVSWDDAARRYAWSDAG